MRLLDPIMAVFVYPAGLLLKCIRKYGVHKLPHCKSALMKIGVFPIVNHYYEPLFDSRQLHHPLSNRRNLPGIDWNDSEQLQLLKSLTFVDEFQTFVASSSGEFAFRIDNGSFGSGDAEFFYNLIRLKKPSRIFEIGAGNSTLVAREALLENQRQDPAYDYQHLCIEPYEMPRLERAGVTLLRQRVENVDRSLFDQLERNDILFIDSSHIIRPQGDVLFEYLEVLPQLKPGVIVHLHDIFSPRDYGSNWIAEEVRFSNEQYLLEAFLTDNRNWKVLAALNYLRHEYYEHLRATCVFLTPDREPGSFYITNSR